MPRPLSLQIPDAQISIIMQFLKMPMEDLRKIVEPISKQPPTPDIEDLADLCASVTGVSADLIDDVISIAVNLNVMQRNLGKTVAQVSQLIAATLARRRPKDWTEETKKAWEDRANVLHTLLVANGTIERMAKARELLQECQALLTGSTILTDVRYIYNDDASSVLGGLIVNTLRIDFVDGRTPSQVHLALSSKDIEKLIEQLQRAQQKVKVATEMLNNSSLIELTPKRDI